MIPVSGNIVVSRDVIFDEASFLFFSPQGVVIDDLSGGDKVKHLPASSNAPT